MDFKISTRHFEISDKTREFMEAKLEKLSKFHSHVDEISTVVTQEKKRYICEIKVKAGRYEADAKDEGLDLIVVFESVLKNIERQIKKHKEKVVDGKKQAKKKVAEVVSSPETEEPVVVKKSIEVPTLLEIEALTKFKDDGADFLLYKNQKTDKICLLIKENEEKIILLQAK